MHPDPQFWTQVVTKSATKNESNRLFFWPNKRCPPKISYEESFKISVSSSLLSLYTYFVSAKTVKSCRNE